MFRLIHKDIYYRTLHYKPRLTSGQYIFYFIFHCGLYCRVVNITVYVLNKEILQFMGLKFAVYNKEQFQIKTLRVGYNGTCTVYHPLEPNYSLSSNHFKCLICNCRLCGHLFLCLYLVCIDTISLHSTAFTLCILVYLAAPVDHKIGKKKIVPYYIYLPQYVLAVPRGHKSHVESICTCFNSQSFFCAIKRSSTNHEILNSKVMYSM